VALLGVAIDSHLFVAYMGANPFFNCFYHHAWWNTLNSDEQLAIGEAQLL